ncbi:hypothetical protein MKW92_039067 [Papaver armeniacum]|nr:hypothetical protein MKW92_039067 [Papaver armeniacum]
MFPFSSGDSFIHVLWSSLPSIGRVADFWVSNGSKWKRHSHTIDLENFSKRLKAFYSHWKENETNFWGASDAIVIATPPASEDLRYLKSSALNMWLYGWTSLLNEVKKSTKDTIGAETVMHVKVKNDDETALMEDILQDISKSGDNGSPIVGYIAKEAPEGNLLELTSNLQLANVTNSNWFKELFTHFVLPKLEKIIDEEKKVTHSLLMEVTEKDVLEPAKVKVMLKADNVDICYPPIFQSGGEFDLRPNASSNAENSYYGSTSVIICVVGSCYNSYCLNMERTFLIDANAMQSKASRVLLTAQEAAIGALKEGSNKVSAVYEAAFVVVLKDGPELVPNLTKIAGTGIGLEFRESGLNLNPKNDRILKARMVFNVSLGFQIFPLLLADIVIVKENIPEVVTMISSKAVKDVAYSFNEDDEEEEIRQPGDVEGRVAKQHQAELVRQKNEETTSRLAGGGSGAGDGRGVARASSDLISYKNVNDTPPSSYGSMVPFLVAIVKSVSCQQDNRTCYIKIIFNVPGTTFTPHDANSLKFHRAIYLKEVSFRSKDPRHISEVVNMIKTPRRQVVPRESESATLVTQEKLQLAGTKFKTMRLSDLWIRPPFGGRGRKLSGTLEAHVNGFRYSTSKPDERVDIMYANKEMITLLHFHLHNHIMVGNKRQRMFSFMLNLTCKAFIVPTSSCLVELIETPFLVVSLNEIEIINLERIGLGQKNFDMTIVFKDFKRNVLRIDSIPSFALYGIKECLDTTYLKYYESRLNLNWRSILKTITDDPEKFIEDGGWEFLNMEVSDSGFDSGGKNCHPAAHTSLLQCRNS